MKIYEGLNGVLMVVVLANRPRTRMFAIPDPNRWLIESVELFFLQAVMVTVRSGKFVPMEINKIPIVKAETLK